MRDTSEYDFAAKPTAEFYSVCEIAYNYLNRQLFDDELPNCLITLQRRKQSYGYFSSKRFNSDKGNYCDEIALNPLHFEERGDVEVLSTLAHEMVHLWQHHFGKPGRGRYHNREWADRMKTIGLYPSDTGKPGGKEIGDSMTHYVIEGGPFERAASELIVNGFSLKWREALAQNNGYSIAGDPIDGRAGNANKSGKRIKYSCPICALNVWARHDAQIDCHEHKLLMRPA